MYNNLINYKILIQNSYLKPSPRHLMAQGRCEEAAEVIQSIAKRNKRKVPKDLLPRLQVRYTALFERPLILLHIYT